MMVRVWNDEPVSRSSCACAADSRVSLTMSLCPYTHTSARSSSPTGMDSAVPIESDRIRASLEKVRFTADDGVQITLPREVADDPDRFEITHNPDGTLSILIRGLQSLRKS